MNGTITRPANPFLQPYRVIFGLVVGPVAVVFVFLLLAWFGPNRVPIFGWYPQRGAAVTAHWCDEMRMPQVSLELQAAVDQQRALPQFAELCGAA